MRRTISVLAFECREMKSKEIWKHICAFGLLVMAMLCGCSDDVMEGGSDGGDTHGSGTIYVRFRMKLADESSTRAGEPAMLTPGTSREDAVISANLFVYKVDNSGDENLIGTINLNSDGVAQILSDTGYCFPIAAKPGETVHVYAAANFTDDMRSRVYEQKARTSSIKLWESDYVDFINEIVAGSNGKQRNLEKDGGSIPMTGQFVTADGGVADIVVGAENSSEDTALEITASLKRIVAKMHVLTMLDESRNMYARSMYADGTRDRLGWIHVGDVRYIPNGVNKSTYLFEHRNASGTGMQDLNMNLEEYVDGDKPNAYMCDDDFIWQTGQVLHENNLWDVMEQSGIYDADSLAATMSGNRVENRYVRGMYCTENYFDKPVNTSFFDSYIDALPMVTHISIAARLIPADIVVAETFAREMNDFVTEFTSDPSTFRKTYGLTVADFTNDDVARWNAIYEKYETNSDIKYFSGTTNLYRNDFRIIMTDDEDEAKSLLNWSLMMNHLWSGSDGDYNNGKYPASTYYVYDTTYDKSGESAVALWDHRYLYLTAGAVTRATGENSEIKTYSVPHVGGWGYYYTYLKGATSTASTTVSYTDSQVERNTYYLVTIGNFGTPGGTLTRPEYIKVNTVSVGWDYSGRGDIILH